MDIKRHVQHLTRRCQSNDPFYIAKQLNINILYHDLGDTLGYCLRFKRSKFIILNCSTSDELLTFVCAHELGHTVLHKGVNTPFLKANTLFSIDKIEREANTFAVELLLSDDLLQEHNDINFYSMARYIGIPNGLEDLKTIL